MVPLTELFSHRTPAFWGELVPYFLLTSFLRKHQRTRPGCFVFTEVVFEFLTSSMIPARPLEKSTQETWNKAELV